MAKATPFYRGMIAGAPVRLALGTLAAAAADDLRYGLAFAGWKPEAAPAAATPAGSAAAPVLTVTVAAAVRPPPAPAWGADSNAGFLREIAPDLFFQFDLAAGQAVFSLLPACDPRLTLPRIRSEILHLLGLCTPALALHAACVATQPAAAAVWIFCGPSGAGKTTISTRLLKELPLIDQETVLLDLTGAHPRLLNTPAPVTSPPAIAGLFQLRQSPHCAVGQLSVSEFIAKNMTRPFDLHLPEFLETRLDKLTRLTSTIAPRELRFNLQPAELLAALRAAVPAR